MTPRALRGAASENLRSGYQACTGAPCSTVSASTADHRRRRRPHGPAALSRRASRGCPVLKSGTANREDEPSLPIRPWPAGVPVAPGLPLRSLADKSARPSVAACARRPVCAVQRPDGRHSAARAWSFAQDTTQRSSRWHPQQSHSGGRLPRPRRGGPAVRLSCVAGLLSCPGVPPTRSHAAPGSARTIRERLGSVHRGSWAPIVGSFTFEDRQCGPRARRRVAGDLPEFGPAE
jgi:hypothetical protein